MELKLSAQVLIGLGKIEAERGRTNAHEGLKIVEESKEVLRRLNESNPMPRT